MRADSRHRFEARRADRPDRRRNAAWWLALIVPLAAVGAGPAPTAQQMAQRRAQVAGMDPSQRQELLRNYERFSAMPLDERQRLRELQREISADPNAQRLHLVLERYHEWLKTLTAVERAELAELPPAKRVERIEHLQRRQRAAQQLELLSRKDMHEIMRWIYELVKEHRQEILAGMSPDERRRFEKQDSSSQHKWLIYRTFRGTRPKRNSKVAADDIDRLNKKLSDGARAELAKATTLDAQRRVVGTWVFATLNRSESRHGGRRMNPLVGEELLQFLQNEVAPARREELLDMPREEMLRELRKMYFERGFPDRRFPPSGSRFKRGDDAPRGPSRARHSGSGDPQDRPGPAPLPATPPVDTSPVDKESADQNPLHSPPRP